jgi:tetratricopeptide (TPR) repeat protein
MAISRTHSARRAGAAYALVLLALSVAVWATSTPAAAAEHPYNEGCAALAAGNVEEATTLFTEAVKMDGEDTDALNNLAVCYMMGGDYGKALPLLEKVLRLNAEYRGADLNIGAGYIFRDEMTKAEGPTRKAQDAPSTANGRSVKAAAYFNLGLIDAQAGRSSDAQASFEKAAKIAPAPEIDVALAGVLSSQGKHDEAIATLQEVETEGADAAFVSMVQTDLAAAYYRRGMARLEAGDIDGAEADFTASNEQATNDYATMGLALVEAENGNRDEAASVLTDLSESASSPELVQAATQNLAAVENMPGGTTSDWVNWLVVYGGGLLFAVQTFVIMRAASAQSGRSRLVVTLGALAGAATAIVFALTFFGVLDSSILVLVALGIDLAVVAITWWGGQSTPRSVGAA